MIGRRWRLSISDRLRGRLVEWKGFLLNFLLLLATCVTHLLLGGAIFQCSWREDIIE